MTATLASNVGPSRKKGRGHLPALALPSWQRWTSVGPSRGWGWWCTNRQVQPYAAGNPCSQPGAAETQPCLCQVGQQPKAHGPGERWGIEPGGGWPYQGLFQAPPMSSTMA